MADFLKSYKKAHPADTVEVLDLWQKKLPLFDGDIINAKYRILHGEPHTDTEKKAWSAVEDIIGHFKSFDKYLFSLPMWNFGIPYILKHYIDILVQPGYTFSYSPDSGYAGLITGRPAVMVCARGGSYPPGTPGEAFDMQKRYMETILGFMGFTGVQSIVVDPTLMLGPGEYAAMVEEKKTEARTLAEKF